MTVEELAQIVAGVMDVLESLVEELSTEPAASHPSPLWADAVSDLFATFRANLGVERAELPEAEAPANPTKPEQRG
jgi:hypothetical protein